MEREVFEKLKDQLISNKMSNLDFLNVLKQFGDAYEPKDCHARQEKEKMMTMLNNIIEHAETLEVEAQDELASQIASWLENPR